MNDLPAVSHRRRLGWWCLLALVLAFFGWGGWREYDYRCAVAEVKEAGPHWNWRTRDPVDVIRWDWRAAFRLATWTDRSRHLAIDPDAEMIAHARLEGPDFAKIHNLLRRLRPTALFARKCKNVDLNGLAGLTDLEEIVLFDCYELRSLDGLQGLTKLRKVVIQNCGLERLDGLQGLTSLRTLRVEVCDALKNIDGLAGLTGLRTLSFNGCKSLQNVDGLRGLTGLESLQLYGCPVQNVDAVKKLTGLKSLTLRFCDRIPAAARLELRPALPKTHITLPDGKNDGLNPENASYSADSVDD